ncbi:hypothetical protein D3C87_1116160 [compost metagenome]
MRATGAPRFCKVSISSGGGGVFSICILRSAVSSVPLIKRIRSSCSSLKASMV